MQTYLGAPFSAYRERGLLCNLGVPLKSRLNAFKGRNKSIADLPNNHDDCEENAAGKKRVFDGSDAGFILEQMKEIRHLQNLPNGIWLAFDLNASGKKVRSFQVID
jgi:hypothetical protein